jgi:hypothetical protein
MISLDPAFGPLGLDDEKYIIARIGGNLITSLHRKIGDMYEGMFLYLLKCRFDLSDDDLHFDVVVTIGDRQQTRSTDGLVPRNLLEDVQLPLLRDRWEDTNGLGFEVRSCYQIGDSKRIQADWDMALALRAQHLTPVMLVFCSTSLRSPLIRLGEPWNLLEGENTFRFIADLTQFDLQGFLRANHATLTGLIKQALAKL